MHPTPATLRKRGVIAGTIGVIGSGFLWLIGFKLVASWLGPEGVGLFSQLRQIIQAATVGATFGGTNTVTQGIAAQSDETTRRQFRKTAARLIGMAGLTVVVFIVFTVPLTAQFFFSSNAPRLIHAMYWVTVAISLSIASTYVLAVLNGYRSYIHLALTQISGPIALTILLLLCWWHGLAFDPVLLAQCFVLCFAFTFTVGVFGMSRQAQHHTSIEQGATPQDNMHVFFRFATANLLATLSATAALLLIRSWIIEEHGLAFVGLFDAGWTLTFNYATIFLSAYNTFYLPTLTATTQPEQQRVCVLKTAYLVLGAFVAIFYTMVVFGQWFITLLFSAQFQPSAPVLQILAIAVIFRAVSWVYGSVILATRQSRTLLISELALNASLLASTRYVMNNEPATLESLSWAFVVPHFLYLVFSIENARAKNKLLRRVDIWPLLLAATLPLLYIACVASNLGGSYYSPAALFFLCSGLATAAATWFAYKKIRL
jgi:PST family polysaccharide transporter